MASLIVDDPKVVDRRGILSIDDGKTRGVLQRIQEAAHRVFASIVRFFQSLYQKVFSAKATEGEPSLATLRKEGFDVHEEFPVPIVFHREGVAGDVLLQMAANCPTLEKMIQELFSWKVALSEIEGLSAAVEGERAKTSFSLKEHSYNPLPDSTPLSSAAKNEYVQRVLETNETIRAEVVKRIQLETLFTLFLQRYRDAQKSPEAEVVAPSIDAFFSSLSSKGDAELLSVLNDVIKRGSLFAEVSPLAIHSVSVKEKWQGAAVQLLAQLEPSKEYSSIQQQLFTTAKGSNSPYKGLIHLTPAAIGTTFSQLMQSFFDDPLLSREETESAGFSGNKRVVKKTVCFENEPLELFIDIQRFVQRGEGPRASICFSTDRLEVPFSYRVPPEVVLSELKEMREYELDSFVAYRDNGSYRYLCRRDAYWFSCQDGAVETLSDEAVKEILATRAVFLHFQMKLPSFSSFDSLDCQSAV